MPNMTSTPGFPEVLGTAGDCQGMPVHMRFLKYSLSPHQTTSDPSALEMEVRELTNSFDPRCNVAILHRLFLHNDLHCQVIEHFFEDVLELLTEDVVDTSGRGISPEIRAISDN